MNWILWMILTIALETGEVITVQVPLATFSTQRACQIRQGFVEVEMARAYPDEPPSTYLCAVKPRKV